MRWLLYRFLPYYLLLSLLLSLGLLVGTELGLRLIWSLVEPRLPAALSIRAVNGRMLDQIRISGLRYVDGERVIRLETAWLRWQPLALLRGQLLITDVLVADGHVTWPAADDTQSPAPAPLAESLPSLPDVRISRVRMRQLTFTNGREQVLVLESGELQAELRDQALRVELAPVLWRDWGRWQLLLRGRMEPQALVLDELNLQGELEPGLRLAGNGRCAWPELDCRANLNWSALRWPLREPRWHSPSGDLTLESGPGGKLELGLDAGLHGEALPVSQLQAQVRQVDAGYAIDAHWLAGTVGALDLNARYELGDATLKGRLRAEQLNLVSWQATLESQLSGQADFVWRQPDDLKLEALQLDGDLRGEPLSLSGRGSFTAQGWSVKDLKLAIAGTRLRGELGRDPRWRGRIELKAPDLQVLHPQLAGSVNLKARFSGQAALPELDWELSARQLAYSQAQLARLMFKGHVDDKTLDWDLQASGGEWPGLSLQELSLGSRGTPERASSRLRLASSIATLELDAISSWRRDPGELQLSLQRGRLQAGEEAWQLQDKPRLLLARNRIHLTPQCWRSEAMRSCLELGYEDGRLQGDWDLDGYRLERLNPRLPGLTQLSGGVQLALRIQPSALDDLQADLTLSTSAIDLARGINGDAETLLQFKPGELSASRRDGEISARWQFPLRDDPGLSGRLKVNAQQQLDGSFQLRVRELNWLGALVPEVLEASGSIEAALNLGGTPAAPRFGGELLLANGRFVLDTPATVLEQVSLKLSGDGSSSMQLNLHAESGQGVMDLDGRLGWVEQRARVEASLSGRDFLAVDTEQARVRASPQLQLSLNGHDVAVNGNIRIPSARLQPRSLGGDTRKAPNADQVILGGQGSSPRYRISSEVEIRLGEDVRFSGFGLNARLGGKLKTRLKPGKPAAGLGELNLINGQYKAYGQDLRIERGRLIFSGGPLTEPGLDVRAYRQATPNIRAGVIVRGTVRRPELSLYSDPAMRETDQLSYLVLGRAAEAQSEEDQAALNNAALALGLKGSDFLARRLKGKLGLDEVRIGTQPGEQSRQASLVLGKYLSPELYISYGLGLFKPIYPFRLRYEISPSWTLQTESGLESGGDLFYTIER